MGSKGNNICDSCTHTCGGVHGCVYTGRTMHMMHYVTAVYAHVHEPCGSVGVDA